MVNFSNCVIYCSSRVVWFYCLKIYCNTNFTTSGLRVIDVRNTIKINLNIIKLREERNPRHNQNSDRLHCRLLCGFSISEVLKYVQIVDNSLIKVGKTL